MFPVCMILSFQLKLPSGSIQNCFVQFVLSSLVALLVTQLLCSSSPFLCSFCSSVYSQLGRVYNSTLPLAVSSYYQLLLCLVQLTVFVGLQGVPTNQYFVVMQAGQSVFITFTTYESVTLMILWLPLWYWPSQLFLSYQILIQLK